MSRRHERTYKKLLALLPKRLSHYLIRKLLPFDIQEVEGVIFKVADQPEEVQQALSLVHKEYVRIGYIEPQDHGLRITPYHIRSATAIIIAKHKDTVIGTLSVIRESRGFQAILPLETVISINHLRRSDQRIAEIATLAVDGTWRRQKGGRVLIHLLKYMFEFCNEHFDVARLVVTVSPEVAPFYEGLFGFKPIDQKVIPYLGAPAVGLWLDLKSAPAWFQEKYQGLPDSKNLYKFFVESKVDSFSFPEKIWQEVHLPNPAADLGIESIDLSSLDTIDRIDVNATAMAGTIEGGEIFKLEFRDISKNGFAALSAKPLSLHLPISVTVRFGADQTCRFIARPVWNRDNKYGFRIEEVPPVWTAKVEAIMTRIQGATKDSSALKLKLKA